MNKKHDENDVQDSIYKEVNEMAKGTGLVTLGEIFGNGSLYLSSILITRVIGANLYGLYFLGNIVIQIGGMISRFGLEFTLLRFVAYFKGKGYHNRIQEIVNVGFVTSGIISLLISIILLIFAPWIAIHIFKKHELTLVIRILALGIPFTNLSTLVVNIFLGLHQTKYKILIENFITPVSRLCLVLLLFFMGMRLSGVTLATSIGTLVTALFAVLVLQRNYPIRFTKYLRRKRRRYLKFSVPILGETLLNYMIFWVDLLILGYFASSSDVGVFGIIIRITMMLVLVQYAFNAVFPPMVSELYGKREIKKIGLLLKIQTRWATMCALPLLIVIIFFPQQILIIFGDSFKYGAAALVIMSIGRFFDASVGVVGMILIMIGKPKVNTINSFIILMLKIVFNIIFIPKYGLFGAAIINSGAIILLNLIRVVEVYYFLKIHPYNLKFIKPLIAAVAGFISFYLLHPLFFVDFTEQAQFLFMAFINIFIYITILYLLKLDEDDRYVLNCIQQKLSIYFIKSSR